jgi:hypothetical protein
MYPSSTWSKVADRCHERCNGERCKRAKGHENGPGSKDPIINQLNHWHQSGNWSWKDGVVYNWKEWNEFGRSILQEANSS